MDMVLIFIICILLFLLALLIVPLKYKADAFIIKKNEEDTWHTECTGTLSLLMGFIALKVIYDENEPKLQIRILQIRVICIKIKAKDKKHSFQKQKFEGHKFNGLESLKKFLDFFEDIFRIIKPKVFIVEGFYGFDDPSTTGALCAIIASLKPFINSCSINLRPVFYEEGYNIQANMSGSFFIIEAAYKTLKFILKNHKRLETN